MSNILLACAEALLYLIYGSGYALLGDTVLVNDICTAISALRVYAISGRRIVLPSLILLLYLPNISINIVSTIAEGCQYAS